MAFPQDYLVAGNSWTRWFRPKLATGYDFSDLSIALGHFLKLEDLRGNELLVVDSTTPEDVHFALADEAFQLSQTGPLVRLDLSVSETQELPQTLAYMQYTFRLTEEKAWSTEKILIQISELL